MTGASQTTTQLLATQERPMIPSDPQPSTSKRKAMTEDNPFTNAAKRLKKEVCYDQTTDDILSEYAVFWP